MAVPWLYLCARARRDHISKYMQVSTRDSGMVRAAHGAHLISTGCILWKNIILADQTSRLDQVIPAKWFLHPQMFDNISSCQPVPNEHQAAYILYVSRILCCMAWKQDAFQHPWDNLSIHAFPPFALQ